MFDTNEDGISWYSVFSAALVYCVLIPISEELIYRRILVNAFSQKVPVLLAFTLSSIMFSLHHERIIASFFLALSCVTSIVTLG
ncbi:type II CAAX prenyl endopeptidase Rce1 family protein [Vibrio sp. MA40-2]|uniref:CPBP family glutamic-type intramembrane protease n=1 Tax=Vibrio sp. MA40-2 TaxID=3391828 RepID=UPI0039A468ED